MNTIKLTSRGALAVAYAVIVVWPCILIMLSAQLPQPAVTWMMLTYAFALLPAYYLGQWLIGGAGYHSLAAFVLLASVVAAVFWPLLLLSLRPAVWQCLSWRRAILAYGAAFVLFAILAAWRMTHSFALFFG